MNHLGVDPASRTGLVWMTDTYDVSSVIFAPKLTGLPRVLFIRDKFNELLDSYPAIDCAVIEGYAYGTGFAHTLATLVEIGSVLRLTLYERRIQCYICPPSVLKKYATGKGNAKKTEVKASVESRWGFVSPSDDVLDAYVLARIAREQSTKGAVAGLERLI